MATTRATSKRPRREKTAVFDEDALVAAIGVDAQRCLSTLRSGSETSAPISSVEDLVQLSVRVPASLRNEVRGAAAALDVSVQEFVLEALRVKLRRVELTRRALPGMDEFVDDFWQMVRNGDYQRDIEDLGDPELFVS